MSGISKAYFEAIDGQLYFSSEFTFKQDCKTCTVKHTRPVSKKNDVFCRIADDYNMCSRHIASGFANDQVSRLYKEIFAMYRTAVRKKTTLMRENDAVLELVANPDFMAKVREMNDAGNRFAAKNGANPITNEQTD